ADHDDRTGAELAIIRRREDTAGRGADAEYVEEVAGDGLRENAFGAIGDGRVHAGDRAHRGERGRGARGLLHLQVDRERDEVVARAEADALERDEVLRTLDRQRAAHERIHDGPDGGIGTDANGNREDGGASEDR